MWGSSNITSLYKFNFPFPFLPLPKSTFPKTPHYHQDKTMPPPKQQPQSPPPPGPLNLLDPLKIIAYSAYYIIPTILTLLLSLQLPTLLSFSAFKSAWFANFWAFFGPRSREFAAPKVMPLLQNNASGICLDIGPGSGEWLYLFARAQNPSITKIYGVEPNRDLHKLLRANAEKAGLGDVYEIIGCGAEELHEKGGVRKGSVDTIITVQCLCSIPTPELIIKELYPLLRPGGTWLVYEHIRTKYTGYFVEYWQSKFFFLIFLKSL